MSSTQSAFDEPEYVPLETFTVCADDYYEQKKDAVSFALATAYRERFGALGEPNWLVMADVAMRTLRYRRQGEPLDD